MNASSVLIHFKESALNHLKDLGYKYYLNDGELDVYVDDVPYEYSDGTYQDPDVE